MVVDGEVAKFLLCVEDKEMKQSSTHTVRMLCLVSVPISLLCALRGGPSMVSLAH
jgi:hypothetical protein